MTNLEARNMSIEDITSIIEENRKLRSDNRELERQVKRLTVELQEQSEPVELIRYRVWMDGNNGFKTQETTDFNDAVRAYQLAIQSDLKDDTVEWNACGLEVFQDDGWTEWESELGEDIDEYLDSLD